MNSNDDLRRYLALAKKWLWLILLSVALAGATAFIVSLKTPPVYEATSTLLVERITSQVYGWSWGGTQWEPLTYAELIPQLLPETAARLGLDKIDADNISVEPVRDTRIVELKVRDHDPQRATDIANTIPLVFDEYTASLLLDRYSEAKTALKDELDRLESDIQITQERIQTLGEPSTAAEKEERSRLETVLSQHRYSYGQLLASYEQVNLAEMQAKGSLVIFRTATVPTTPVLPRTMQNTLLAGLVGGMLALGAVLLVEYLDDTLKTPEDVARVLGLVTIGSIVRFSGKHDGRFEPLVTVAEPRSPVSEAFRVLRTNLQFSSVDRPLRRLLVTSCKPSEGKTLLAANLAAVFAQTDRSVVLVDCDLRRPTLHQHFKASSSTGLTDSLLSNPDLQVEKWMQPTAVDNLRLLASGRLPPNPAEMLGSQRMGQVAERLAQELDMVIFDSPPVLAVTDPILLSQWADGVLLVVEAGVTREREARRALEELQRVGAPLLGVALNKIPGSRSDEYGYYYHRHYYADDQSKSGRKTSRRSLFARKTTQ